jgi:hypothetical protein
VGRQNSLHAFPCSLNAADSAHTQPLLHSDTHSDAHRCMLHVQVQTWGQCGGKRGPNGASMKDTDICCPAEAPCRFIGDWFWQCAPHGMGSEGPRVPDTCMQVRPLSCCYGSLCASHVKSVLPSAAGAQREWLLTYMFASAHLGSWC